MEKELLLGLMVDAMLETILMTKSKASEFLLDQMAKNMKAPGLMENSTEKESISLLMEKRKKENGKMEIE